MYHLQVLVPVFVFVFSFTVGVTSKGASLPGHCASPIGLKRVRGGGSTVEWEGDREKGT